jgi:integrative and conjugative element protein (TIGR02256 family)
MDNEGAVTVSTAEPRPVRRLPTADWAIFYDEGLLDDIRVARGRALPAETGGVLVGIVDVDRKVILVVDALSPPADSTGSRAEFFRGVDGLTDRLREVCAITRDQVRYVGEWHTHPRCHGATPSSTDLAQLEFLRVQLGREGIPPVMMIMGEQGEAVVSAFRSNGGKDPDA